MKLKCETILDIYTHQNKTILCQIKVPPSKDKQQSRKTSNTCRFLTRQQWETFDVELEYIIKALKDSDKWDEEKVCKFNIKPNIDVKVQKSKLSTKIFYNCLEREDDVDNGMESRDAADSSDVKAERIVYVLECLLDFKELTPPIVSIVESQEYEPEHKTSPDGKSLSPLSYEPYTPSKKTYRTYSRDTVKTPGADFLGYESVEDRYSPIPVFSSNSGTTISETSASTIVPEYKPAPIKEKRSSTDSVKSKHGETVNEVVNATDEEETSANNYRSLRNRKTKKQAKEIEYIPKSQEINEAPAYVPTPIEDIKISKKEKERKFERTEENIKGNKENNRNGKNLDKIDDKPSGSHVDTRQKYQASKKVQSVTKDRTGKKLEFREKSSTKSQVKKKELSNEELAQRILEIPLSPTLSDGSVKSTVEEPSSSSTPIEHPISARKSRKKTDDDFEDKLTKNSKKSQESSQNKVEVDLNITLSSATESASDSLPPKKSAVEIPKKLHTYDKAHLRRSERSPIKTKRLIEETAKLALKKKSEVSPLNKELFGSSDEDDDKDFEKNTTGDNNNNAATASKFKSAFHTPKNENSRKLYSSSSSSSAKKKRKRDKSSDCEQEKRQMSSWLGKKKSSSDLGAATTSKEKSKSSRYCKSPPSKSSKKSKSSKDIKKRRSKSESPPPSPKDFVIPTKEELDELRLKTKRQQENNEKVKAELDKCVVPPPKQVENLSLQDMSISDLLDTFNEFKPILDEIYEKNRKKDHIKSHDGINHCFVIRLMEPQTQMKMLQMLTDVYSNSKSTTQATLYANAMLPEWIIRIYMEKYQFSREQAMEQIKAQDDYQLHIDGQNESTFDFD